MTKRYDIFNPSTARRVIHSGGAESRAIEIRPRSSVENVELADHVVERLLALAEKDRAGTQELQLRPAEFSPEQEPPPPSDEVVVEPKLPAMKMTIDDSKIGVIKATPEPAPAPKKGRR